MLLFDDKFPMKKFIMKTLGLSESDWVLAQPKKNLSDIKNENTFVLLPSNKEIEVTTIPIEVIKLFKIWKMNKLDIQTIEEKDTGNQVSKQPILREKFAEVFGDDVNWEKPKMRGLARLAQAYHKPIMKEKMTQSIKKENLEIPMWAIEK